MGMRVLADTNVFIKFCRRLPLPALVERTFENPSTDRLISAVSVIELFRLWQAGRVPDNPDTWLDDALSAWQVVPVTAAIARLSVLWDWDHRDPADRLIAATAKVEGVELWHTDTQLKRWKGFPQRYFVNVPAKSGAERGGLSP